MALIVTDENIEKVLGENKITVLDFWAEWCGPCRVLGPIIDTLSTDEVNKDVTIGKIDVDANSALANKYGIRSIPTVLFIKGGEVVDKSVGASNQAVLQSKIDSLR